MTDIPPAAQRPAPRISFVSLGCPKALVDSERILTRLRAEGYELARSHAGADAVIVNTCGFLDSAKKELLAAIGQAMNENGHVIVTGCMGAKPDDDPRRFSERLGDHRPAGVRERDGGGARRRARARAIRSSISFRATACGSRRAITPISRSRRAATTAARSASFRACAGLSPRAPRATFCARPSGWSKRA